MVNNALKISQTLTSKLTTLITKKGGNEADRDRAIRDAINIFNFRVNTFMPNGE